LSQRRRVPAALAVACYYLKHYRITLFDKQGKAVFSIDKHSPGAATKDVCKFLSPAK
jgi:hypothetical protein